MTSARADAIVIQNPAAGTRHPERLRARLAAGFARLGFRAEIHVTSGPGSALDCARRAVEEAVPRVIVAGGDGTVSEVAQALVGTPAVLGVVPCGTGNQLAFYLGIPTALDRAIATAMSASTRVIDVGTINGRAFVAMAGAGLDAAVIAGARQSAKRRWGTFAYLFSGLAAGFRLRSSRIEVRVGDGHWEGDGVGVLVANVPALRVPLVPRGLTVVPGGSAEDGALDCCVLATSSVSGLSLLLWRALLGRPGDGRRLLHWTGTTLEIAAEPPLPVQIDGDLVGRTPFRATIEPAALRVAAPPATSAWKGRDSTGREPG